MIRLLPLAALAFLGLTAQALAQTAPAPAPAPAPAAPSEKPVTPPNSFRVLMENERIRMIELNINPHSKVNVESTVGRERFLYMLTDGALVLAPPGKAAYEFALHAGETALFPAVSPTVENDSDQPVRALMVELKQGVRVATSHEPRGKRRQAKSTKRGKPDKKAKKTKKKSKR